MHIKIWTVAALLSLAVAGNTVGATDVNREDTTFVGEIYEWESGDIYKMKAASGQVIRVDLGEYGGRLLHRTPFSVSGEMSRDTGGPLLVMHRMEYTDPDPFAEYFAALRRLQEPQSAGLALTQVRDKAFDHENPVSDHPMIYQNNVKQLSASELAAYQKGSIQSFTVLPAGSKVVFIGRAIHTVIDREVMRFWDTEGQAIDVQMNGAYCPLGQRCIVYGTWEQRGTGAYIQLDYMESLDLPAEDYR